MHDLDRTLLETENPEAFAQPDEPDSGYSLSPVQELELTSELLEVGNEADLEQFLGTVLNKTAGAARRFASSKRGRAVTAYLKSTLKQSLPSIGRSLGERVRPGGGDAGAQIAEGAGKLLGLELEGLSPEDEEFEAARQLVRMASSAARRACLAPRNTDPDTVARQAVTEAVRAYAPGLEHHERKVRAMKNYDIDLADFEPDARVLSPLSEEQEEQLAYELLEVEGEEDLEEFLGGLIGKVGKAVGGFIKSPVGHALGGILKRVAKKALPVVGGAIGTAIAPGIGTAIGSTLGNAASNLFEMDLESMPEDEAQLEVARRVVGLTAAAACHAAHAPQTGVTPRAIAWDAVLKAAKEYAPGLYRQLIGQTGNGHGGGEDAEWEEFARAGGHRRRPGPRPRRPRGQQPGHDHDHDGVELGDVAFGGPVVENWGPDPITANSATANSATANGATADDDAQPATGTWERRGRRIILHGV